uniref:Uncharacterized protein n=1 Tax=Chrysemys picta bellii TaxID=8478 RepID=A0A8C3HTS0_CHRPI
MERGKDIEEILRGVTHSRCVGVEITNKTTVAIRSPSFFCYSGHTFIPPAPAISPGCKETCVFVKRNLSAWGVAGALTYEWAGFSFILMFSNPFDNNLHHLQYALEICEGRMSCKELESLYHIMRGHRPLSRTYQKDRLGRNTTALVVTLHSFQISATMSNHSKAALRILIEERGSPPSYTTQPPCSQQLSSPLPRFSQKLTQ